MRENPRRVLVGRVLLVGGAFLAGGCVTTTESVPVLGRSAEAGIAPALVVERFLHAVNANDLDTMARLFGTRDGSVLKRDPRAEVERRMYALAAFLRHEDYGVAGEGVVPGRLGEAVQLMVRMKVQGKEVTVPFTIVQTKDEGWLVEAIDLEKLTAGS